MSDGNAGYDVAVIGGGLAGLIAANRAAELGRRVMVLEKSAEEQYPSNSRYTYGTFHIHFTGVDDDEDALFERIETATEGFARKDLARSIARNGRRLMQWLRGEGVELVDLGDYQTNVLSPPWRTGFGLEGIRRRRGDAAARGELPQAPGPHPARHAGACHGARPRRHRA